MRIPVVLFLLLGLASLDAKSQCTPSLTGPGGAISPDTTINLPPSSVGVTYDADIQFFVPSDTIAPGLGSVSVQDFTLTSMTGFPTGFTYTSNPSSGVFPGGTAGCTHIHGTAPSAAMVGTYPLIVYLTAHVTFASIPVKDTVYGYKIQINASAGIEEESSSNLEVTQIGEHRTGETKLLVTAGFNEIAEASVFSIDGKLLQKQSFEIHKGQEEIPFSMSGYSDGIYLMQIRTSSATRTIKFILSNR